MYTAFQPYGQWAKSFQPKPFGEQVNRINKMAKTVIARFRCNEVIHREQQKEARFSAVNRMDGDNADFTKYTPGGNLQISITNDAPADGFFQPGKTYNLEFSEYAEAE